MPRKPRPKPSNVLVSEEILKAIKSYRPLRLFIDKQKRKGNADNPFTLRVQFCQLPLEKQARYLQKSVDKYIQLLDENDIDENVQVECKLFDYLLMKGEQKKYFQSINAPEKPPGTAIPYYTQVIKQEHFDENEPEWKSLSINEQQSYKKMRKEAKAEYLAKVRNFANDLPDRLRPDYLSFAEPAPSKRQTLQDSFVNNHDDTITSRHIRQRRKSLTALPESLQTTSSAISMQETHLKLTKVQLNELHKCMPGVLYYEANVSDNARPTFTKAKTKNGYIRSIFKQLNEKEKIKYISKSIKKWTEFLELNPNITENLIGTLHLLLIKNEDILLYFSSIGLPERPPINSYLLYNHEKEETGSQQTWSDLTQTQRDEYTQQLAALKNEYYEKLVQFVDHILPTDYMRYEFFRNIKYAIKDYEAATKSEICDKNTGQLKFIEFNLQRMGKTRDLDQFNQIKQRLLSTELSMEQRSLIEELTHLLYKYIH